MTSISILARLRLPRQPLQWDWSVFIRHKRHKQRHNLHQLARQPDLLPSFVQQSAVAMRYINLLGDLDWEHFPERDLETDWGMPAVPFASFVAACLVKLDQQFVYMSHLHQYLVEHPALVWVLGFPLKSSAKYAWGFDPQASLPTARHFTRLLRKVSNTQLQFLLDETVRLLQTGAFQFWGEM